VIVSCTITDRSGRTLSGQTIEAFWYSVEHAKPLAVASIARSVRPRCGPTSRRSRPSRRPTSRSTRTPAANAFGEYDELPEQTAAVLREFGENAG